MRSCGLGTIAAGAAPSEIVAGFGTLNADTLALEDIAANSRACIEMVDRVGLND